MPATNGADKRLSIAHQQSAVTNPAFAAHIGLGRPKGSLNRTTRKVRETVLRVFERMGGEKKFLEWSIRNPDEFYRYFMRLLPVEDRAQKPSVQIVLVKNADKV